MFSQTSKEVRECMRHAEECAHRARVEPDPNLQVDFLNIERRWLKLARSYLFAERLELFTSHDRTKIAELDRAMQTLSERMGDLAPPSREQRSPLSHSERTSPWESFPE
jgi:hypothetical protein